MLSDAHGKVDVPLSSTAASEALVPVLKDLGYKIDDGAIPGSAEIVFTAKRSLLYVKRQGIARIAPDGTGSTIELEITVYPGQPAGLLDGRHNQKMLAELTDKVAAALS